MKILKKAQQRNFILNLEYYTEAHIYELLQNSEVFFFAKNPKDPERRTFSLNTSHDFAEWVESEKPELRIFADSLTEVKVICIDGYYETVVIGENGKTYYIKLN